MVLSLFAWCRACPTLRFILVGALAALTLVVLPGQPAAAAGPAISLTKNAPASVLLGAPINYSLTASNPEQTDAVQEYNASFHDVLPLGVTYEVGSTSPASRGEPTVYTDDETGQQTLVWSNVADLAVNSNLSLSFQATAADSEHPVGSSVQNNADLYANSSPRTVPRFDADGEPSGGFTETASASAQTTVVSAIKVDKTEPSPENELVRGLHDDTTVYRIEVTNNDLFATDDVTVVDFLPAGLEFLGCGGVDHTSGDGREYPGAPRLTGTPDVGANCPAPTGVDTVTDPSGHPAGTYTKVTWALGDLTGGEVRTIRYAAAIGMRKNVTSFDGPKPSAASGDQAANLDNNTGGSTRETGAEQAYTNEVQVSGTYQGPVAPGLDDSVTADDSQTVTAEDVALAKTVTPSSFVQGNVASYTLTVRGSEYTSGSDIVVTDHLPNGLCPLDDTDNYVTGAPAECGPDDAYAPTGATIDAVAQNGDGSFDINFSPVTVDPSRSTTITYQARMRSVFTGGDPAGKPTASGDAFTNTVDLEGTSTLVDGTDPPDNGTETVADDSQAELASGGAQLAKTIGHAATPMDCEDAEYSGSDGVDESELSFAEGSRVCFRIRVDFSDNNATRNPVVTDFLPDDVAYESGSAQTLPGSIDADLDTSGLPPDGSGGGTLRWSIGAANDEDRYAQPGDVFEVQLSGIVVTPASGDTPDVTGNLAKMRYENSAGQVTPLRDSVDFYDPPAPPVGVDKHVVSVDGDMLRQGDGVDVVGGETVRYTVDLTNQGSAAGGNEQPIGGIDTWDILPEGIACAAVATISDGGACTNPGDTGHPSFDGPARSAVRWQLANPLTLAAGATRSLTYDVALPSAPSVSTSYDNTAAVRSYETGTNRTGELATHYPANNVDATVTADQEDASSASDGSEVHTAQQTVAKTNTTEITEPGNGTTGSVEQAVVGEVVDYTISARVPAHSTVYNGAVTDELPSQLTFVDGSAAAGFSADGTGPAEDPLPTGVTLDPGSAALDFPVTYTNDTDTAQLFQVTLQARVNTTNSKTSNNVSRTNTATFAGTTAAGGGTAVPPATQSSRVAVISPAPSIDKTDDAAGGVVTAGQTVTYTLTAANAAGRPPLHDSSVLDCVPVGLVVDPLSLSTENGTATTALGTGTNGCDAGQTVVSWTIGDVPGGQSYTLDYDAMVAPEAAGSQTYPNTATLTGSTLGDGANDSSYEHVYTTSKTDTVAVQSTVVTKSADSAGLTIGERGSWTVTVEVPPNVNFYDAAVIDRLPAGIDPATVTTTEVTCQNADETPCSVPGTELSQADGPDGTTLAGWSLGDLTSSAQARTVTVEYTAVVDDVAAAQRGNTLTNTADLRWDTSDGTDKTSAGAAFDAESPDAPAAVTVQEPLLDTNKSIDDPTPAPGQDIDYTVTVHNAAGTNTSPAHNVTVEDSVPAGIVVDPGTISNAGTLSGAGDDGGGTISWTLTSTIGPDATRSLTYTASLAASDALDGDTLTNTADVTSYRSLEDAGRTYDGPSATADATPAFPHVSVSKQILDGAISYVGSAKSWRITATNDGDSTAYGVDAHDTLPTNWTYQPGATVSVAGGPAGSVEPGQSGTADQELDWQDLGNIDPGQSIVITFDAQPTEDALEDPGAGHGTAHTNTATTSASDATGASGSGEGSYAGEPATATARIDSADIQIAKTHTGTPVAGDAFSWKLTASNDGPDTAVGPFTVTDTLPEAVNGASASGDGWTCTSAAGSLTCDRTDPPDTLASGEALPTITVTGTIDSDTAAGATLSNDASLTARTYDADPDDNATTDTATVQANADLALDKKLSGDLVAGQEATYTLDASNLGPSTARGPITVSDGLPAGTTFVSADGGSDWTCDQGTGTVTCTHDGDVAVGGALQQIVVKVDVDADRTADVVNTASVEGATPDPVDGNDSDTVTTTPDRSADLGLSKSSDAPFVAGEEGTYALQVHNYGPSTAAAPQITDTLPGYLDFAGSTSDDGYTCSAAGQEVTCNGPELAVGADAAVTITVAVASGHTGAIVNTATVDSATPDPTEPNNSDTDDNDTAGISADLAITKQQSTDPAVAGQDVSYTLDTTNNGPSDSPGPITVTDTYPDGTSLASATGTGWECTDTAAQQRVTCEHAGGVTADADLPTIAVTLHVDPSVRPGTLPNIATIDGPAADPDADNDRSSVDTSITNAANVSITKTVQGPDTVVAGAEGGATFELTVHNDGPSDASAVTVSDPSIAGLSAESATADDDSWDCHATDGDVLCDPTTLAADDTVTITVTSTVGADVAPESTLTNAATVATTTAGDDDDDNDATAQIDVETSADLEVSKTHTTQNPTAGEPVTYEVAVHNNGPSDAAGPVTVTDTLPDGLTYLASGNDWDCAATGSEVACTLPGGTGIAAQADAPPLTITAQAAPGTAGAELQNSVAVSSGTSDPEADNDIAADTVTPSASADLSVVKAHTGAAHVGEQLAFTLAVNNDGPSDAADVVVTDTLPIGLAAVDADGDGWTCTDAGAEVTCTLDGSLAAGGDADPITVTTSVRAAAYPQVTNAATVASSAADPDPSNDTARDDVSVPALTDLSIAKSHTGHLVVGQTTTYHLKVTNDGPTDDPGTVTVQDRLPNGLSFVRADGRGWACEDSGPAVTCRRVLGLEAGAVSSIDVVTRVHADAYPSVTNLATVSSPAEDSDPSNDQASDTGTVSPVSHLRITKTAASRTDSNVRWRITVSNDGPSPTTEAVVVVDRLPRSLVYDSAGGEGWHCEHAAKRRIRCEHRAVLEAGAGSSFTVGTGFAPKASGKVTNAAQVTSGDPSGTQPAAQDTVRAPGGETGTNIGNGPDNDDDNGTVPHTGNGPDNDDDNGTVPNTGGPSLWLLVGAVGLVAAGATLLRRRRN